MGGGGGLQLGEKNDFMLIKNEFHLYHQNANWHITAHTRARTCTRTHTRGGSSICSEAKGGAGSLWHTYRERKCHPLARPASQWSPSSSSGWRIPAAQRQEPPHRWTCVYTKGASHGAVATVCHDSSPKNSQQRRFSIKKTTCWYLKSCFYY